MSSNGPRLLRISRLISPSRPASPILSTHLQHHYRQFNSSRPRAAVVDSEFLSQITAAEKKITNQDGPVQGGPTARAQSHVGNEITRQVVHDITEGERSITGKDGPIAGGPTSVAQSVLTSESGSGSVSSRFGINQSTHSSGVLDSETISKITEKEKRLSGEDGPVQGGPTAQAQSHAGEPITSQALHDITEGEKKITGGERVKGGPTSTAQSELAKSRQV